MNLAGAAGLALSAPGAANSYALDKPGAAYTDGGVGSNLDVVSPDGQVREAVTSGKVTVSKFLLAPGGKAYLLFASRVNLADTTASNGRTGCILAEVSTASDIPTCVDESLSSVTLMRGVNNWPLNVGIQFDSSGAIYYAGGTSDGKTVLRRYKDGATTDLINDNIYLVGFSVLPDGTVIVAGWTNGSDVRWLRKINPAGGLSSLLVSNVEWLDIFPDGNVYAGYVTSGGPPEIRRYLTASGTMDPKPWVGAGGEPTNYFDKAICGAFDCARILVRPTRTLSGKVYSTTGYGNRLIQYYPTLEAPTTLVTKTTKLQSVLNHLVIAGLNASDQNVMYLHDTATGVETQLIGPANEIEIYHLNYSANGSKVMFDGLRFADNKYVLGEVNVNTGELRVTAALAGKWDDFQAFG